MSTNTARRRSRRQETGLWRVPVRRVEQVTPRLVRVTVGGDELAGFVSAGTDQNVMLYFYPDDVPPPETLEDARARWSTNRPLTRTYTIRRHDPAAHELDFDFVLHDAPGPASDWAKRATPGDHLILVGPSPAYQPDPTADWHLLAGDETALPAIAAILDVLPDDAVTRVFVEVEDAAEEQPLPAPVTWTHRADGGSLAAAVAAAELPDGRVDAWLAGERSSMVELRAHLLDQRGFDRRQVRPTTYWRRGAPGS
ncbi:siderophore-interacting protein [Actinophytocola gossypii]|uniref:Siderophore-interacting protein n=1 Tax=Actinophytocola gossypii TaxID=2812003 RepID=A0ABT2JH48_9PSEU|nr:siderophore-interacting protein [Actinophytocola gossypii]MCT2587213.1 siderophore-interacting protein [Actinophytocola gossypii]